MVLNEVFRKKGDRETVGEGSLCTPAYYISSMVLCEKTPALKQASTTVWDSCSTQ